jgi:hypothetical protein
VKKQVPTLKIINKLGNSKLARKYSGCNLSIGMKKKFPTLKKISKLRNLKLIHISYVQACL